MCLLSHPQYVLLVFVPTNVLADTLVFCKILAIVALCPWLLVTSALLNDHCWSRIEPFAAIGNTFLYIID